MQIYRVTYKYTSYSYDLYGFETHHINRTEILVVKSLTKLLKYLNKKFKTVYLEELKITEIKGECL